jgi:hypothetical protein
MRPLKRPVGAVLCAIPSLRRALLDPSYSIHGLRGVLRALATGYWVERVYLAEPDPDRREALKADVIGGAAGVRWAAHYAAAEVVVSDKDPLLGWALDVLQGSPPQTVIQVGCSSGRELAWLAARAPRHHFVGTDPYEEVVVAAQQRFPNLIFQTGSAQQIDMTLARHPSPALVLALGSLQFVQPEHLPPFFRAIASARARVMISEPGHVGWDDLKGSRWNGGIAWSHDYRWYAEQGGLRTERCLTVTLYPSDHPTHGTVTRMLYTSG